MLFLSDVHVYITSVYYTSNGIHVHSILRLCNIILVCACLQCEDLSSRSVVT